jgi:uncharacterized membrane protein (GlpM family)
VEIVLKALIGGALVVAFAVLAETLSPKRFAGVFAAAPTIAVGSLVITVAYSGSSDARRACAGMVAGAAGFIAYCLLAPHVVQRFGALRGSAITLTAWVGTVAVVLPAMAATPVAKAAAAIAPVRRPAAGSRPHLRCDPSKLREVKPREALIRFAFGAGTSAVAGLVSRWAGPFVGGAWLAFPAMLLASLTLVADEEGEAAARDDARGARAGAVGLLCFAAVGAAVFTVVAAPLAIVIAASTWLVAALGTYGIAWATGHGGDEANARLVGS